MPPSRSRAGTQRPLDLPGRMAATDALFWYAEAALPEFRPIIAGLYQLDRAPDPGGPEAATDAALADRVAADRLAQLRLLARVHRTEHVALGRRVGIALGG